MGCAASPASRTGTSSARPTLEVTLRVSFAVGQRDGVLPFSPSTVAASHGQACARPPLRIEPPGQRQHRTRADLAERAGFPRHQVDAVDERVPVDASAPRPCRACCRRCRRYQRPHRPRDRARHCAGRRHRVGREPDAALRTGSPRRCNRAAASINGSRPGAGAPAAGGRARAPRGCPALASNASSTPSPPARRAELRPARHRRRAAIRLRRELPVTSACADSGAHPYRVERRHRIGIERKWIADLDAHGGRKRRRRVGAGIDGGQDLTAQPSRSARAAGSRPG